MFDKEEAMSNRALSDNSDFAPFHNRAVSHNRSPLLNNPNFANGLNKVTTRPGIRGRTEWVYEDALTGEHIVLYGPVDGNAI